MPDEDLRIANNQTRGAVRFTGAGATGEMRLHAIQDFDQHPDLVTFAPGFVGKDFVEFYGLDAGRRSLYLEVGDRTSALQAVEVLPHRIARLAMPELRPSSVRQLVLEGAATIGASLLLEYGDTELLSRWQGKPIELRSPLAEPRKVTVSLPAEEPGSRRLGMASVVEAGVGELRLRLPEGDRTVRLAGAADTRPEARFAIDLTAGHRVTVEAVRPATKDLLAVLRPDEFAVPPRVHTWSTMPLGKEVAITGIGAGETWVGVGFERLARYVLWRRQPDGVGVVSRVAPSQAAKFRGDSARLPLWIRSLGTDDPLSSGSRAEHDFGPGQVWEQVITAGGKWQRLAAWVDGQGGHRPVTAKQVEMPLPPGAMPGDELRLVVRVPHSPRGDGVRFALESGFDASLQLPALPDGLVDATLSRRGRQVAVLHSVIHDGRFLGRASAWSDSDGVSDEWRQLQVRVVDGAGAGVPGAKVYSEAGTEIATTDANGTCSIERAAPARRPTFVSVGEAGQFTNNAYASGVEVKVGGEDAGGMPMDWAALQAVLGLELASIGVDAVMLGKQARGETCGMTANSRVTIAAADTLEFAGGRAGIDVWGWFDATAAASAVATEPPRTAEIVLVNYGSNRSVHVSLPRTEVRLGLERGRQQRVVVHAPARVSLTSVVATGHDGENALVDEGIAAELSAGDVLVLTYKGR